MAVFIMNDILEKVRQLMPDSVVELLSEHTNPASMFLLQKAEKALECGTNRNVVKEALLSIQAVMDMTWEQLNTGHWSNVPLHQRQLYTATTLLKIVGLLQQQTLDPSGINLEILQKALQVTDLGLLLGAPLTGSKAGDLTIVAQIISTAVAMSSGLGEEHSNIIFFLIFWGINSDSKLHNFGYILNFRSRSLTAVTHGQDFLALSNRGYGISYTFLSSPVLLGENKMHSSITETSCKEQNECSEFIGVKGQPVPVLQRPSLEMFRNAHFTPHLPVLLTGCMTHWPAMTRWSNIEYLRQRAGARTVPIELGAHYVHPLWSQKLMTISEFLDIHVTGQVVANKIGYLAQHPLFDQVPELKADIYEPEYCCLSENTDDDAVREETDINAWFGPKGTVSPLHHDPKHNLLTQVVGEKRVLLYAPSDSARLYPHEGSLLKNTAQVDPESPDYATYPEFKNTSVWECHLKSGEMLYIPPTWWHHVRALTTSFSVSFWWM